MTVVRHSHVDRALRPAWFVRNLVSIRPGKKLWQFFTLPEARLVHGDTVSLFVCGSQPAPGALVARVVVLKIDSQDGTWSPSKLGCSDGRTFAKHGRGELVPAYSRRVLSKKPGYVELRIESAKIVGHFRTGPEIEC